MRRIAIISEHASPLALVGGVDAGGQNVYVAQTARHLARLGWEVDVFTRRDSGRAPDVVEWKERVRVVHVNAGPPRYVRKEELLPYMDRFTDQCVQFIDGGNPYDIVHANFWMSGLVAAEIKQKRAIPFVITFHALGRVRRLYQREADGFPDERFSIEERIIDEAGAVIAECPQDREDLISLYNAKPEKITVIPCGFDPAEFWHIDKFLARRELGLPKEGFIVLQLGRIVPRKGIDTVIRGFARFLHEHPVPAQLLVVGGESPMPNIAADPEMARLRQIAADEGIAANVSFLGRRKREKLRYYYNAADVFVTTPWYEPFGITPLEAMACGAPVIGSDVGGIKYSVVNGETGYLVPPKDHEQLAHVLSRLYTHPSVREDLGKAGMKRVNRYFTWQKVTKKIAGLYEEVLESVERRPVSREGRLQVVDRGFDAIVGVINESRRVLDSLIIEVSLSIAECFRGGGKLFVCGNGGSAADAQHFVGELVGRFKSRNRPGLPALALTADSAVLTAWSNDMGYENVFARQVQALAREGDILLCLSTTGQSPNLIKACDQAHEAGLSCIALVGCKGGELAHVADTVMLVPSSDVQRVQEVQLLTLHLISELVEEQVIAWAHASAHERSETQLSGVSRVVSKRP